MSITDADIRHIASLARLELTDEEVERFRDEMTRILDYVARLEELEAGRAAEPENPDQPLRDDVVAEWPDVGPLHDEAPELEDGYVRVPRVVE